MKLEVLPLEEADVPTYARLHFLAFTGGISPFLNPDPAASERRFAQELQGTISSDPGAFFLKVVDTTTGDIVACGKWLRLDKERTPEEVAKENIPPPPPEGASTTNLEAWNDLFGWLSEAKTVHRAGHRCWCESDPFGHVGQHLIISQVAHRLTNNQIFV